MNFKRFTSFLVASAIMSVSVFAGGQSDSAEMEKVSVSKEYSLPLVDELTTLTVMVRENQEPTASTYGSGLLPVIQEMERLTNVKIEWITAVDDEYDTMVQLRLAAGEDLPDLVAIENPVPYLKQGIFQPMTELIKTYAPDVQKLMNEHPDWKGSLTAMGGEVYTVTEFAKFSHNPKITHIRQDWLDNLGLEMPTTTDEFYTVLKAFKNEDANGNGDLNDEIPWFSYYDDSVGSRTLANTFQVPFEYGDYYDVNEDGDVEIVWLTEQGEDYVGFMNKLYSEGLFRLVSGSEKTQWRDDNLGGVHEGWNNQMTAANRVMRENGVTDAKWAPIPPMTSKWGEGYYIQPHASRDYETGLFLSADSKNPELAVKWINFLFSEEGFRLASYGIEGLSYEMVDGSPKIIPEWFEENDTLKMIGGAWTFARANTKDTDIQRAKMTDPEVIPAMELGMKYGRGPNFPKVMAEGDEVNVEKAIGTDIITYINENVMKFMMGDRDINEYKDFISEVENLGLADLLEVKQIQYQRYTDSVK